MYWTALVGQFDAAGIRFKGEDVEPHESHPGYPALGEDVEAMTGEFEGLKVNCAKRGRTRRAWNASK